MFRLQRVLIVRIAACLLLTASLAAGCAATPAIEPREYLDEQTAATIRVVAEPVILVRTPANPARDFLNLYAVDVNRMGHHQQYLAVLGWWSEAEGAASMELHTSTGPVTLTRATQPARELGIAQPIDETAPRDANWWYFQADKAVLDRVARSPELRVRVHGGEEVKEYAVWRDASSQLAELSATLPQ